MEHNVINCSRREAHVNTTDVLLFCRCVRKGMLVRGVKSSNKRRGGMVWGSAGVKILSWNLEAKRLERGRMSKLSRIELGVDWC